MNQSCISCLKTLLMSLNLLCWVSCLITSFRTKKSYKTEYNKPSKQKTLYAWIHRYPRELCTHLNAFCTQEKRNNNQNQRYCQSSLMKSLVDNKCYGQREPGLKVIPTQRRVQSPRNSRPKTPVADLKSKTRTKLNGSWTLSNWLPGIRVGPSDSVLEDLNDGLRTTATITRTNKLIHRPASVLFEALCYKINFTEKLLESHLGKRGIIHNTINTRCKNRPQSPPRTARKTNMEVIFRPSQHQVHHLGDALSSLLSCSSLNPQVM